ncbi:MAG: VWA domain-containing protein [Chloroflexi bacterium AL-W]|nr:VWA domain-containing protein [Chloroflexi bacterium AL-N1]NOK67009.1 VWA domain-containing protein [Chloroflexi bacterium AL-N10]NOK74699.1 VWA domain-containing protein [Chloroflexi bacterium AL-N5]NOK81611.1 VWA domain-containing protein [Chloroflexi bacterium AL-W]NOK89081.1 VWA domain-containing protein [Chloroflexi bacterium AL-N15]
MIWRNPEALFLLFTIPFFVLIWYRRRGRLSTTALALRLLSVVCIILALADPTIMQSTATDSTTVLLVDQSDSLGETQKTELRELANELIQNQDNATSSEHDNHIIFFGANTTSLLSDNEINLRSDHTDVAQALRTAYHLVGRNGGRIVLISDGNETRGDVLAEAHYLASNNVSVDTIAYGSPEQSEVWVTNIDVPPTLREGEEYAVLVSISSNEATNAQLQLFDNATELAHRDVPLEIGENTFTFRNVAGTPGIAQLRVSVTSPTDTFAQNNSAAATALVAPPPRVLLVEGENGGSSPLRVALRSANIETDVMEASFLPTQLSLLDSYEGMVLVDVPAGNLTLDQMTTIREFVRSEGRGLLVTGGRSSFTLGAYRGTPLEEVLPVTMTPPPRPQRSQVSLLLIVDQSASMGGAIGTSKLDMAKESAILATESLRDEDRLGVLAFDTFQSWAVEFQELGTGLSLGQIQERITQIPLGGGTDIFGALEVGLQSLNAQPGDVRHAVLLTDGRSFSNFRNPYQGLIELARENDMTLSTIAIGQDADIDLLQDLAQWGAGRYHFASQAEDIPRLTLLESEIARTEPQIEGGFRANLSDPHPLLRGYAPNEIPNLNGYVATTLKPEAELVLQSPEDDPVLAVWQYGLGRAIAWTPSVETPWADSWSNWPEYGAFWGQIIRYTLPEPDSGLLQIHVTPHGDEVTISADSLASGGTTVDLADTQAEVQLPDGTTRRIPLRQTEPGRYEQTVTLPSDGAYAIEVRQVKDELQRTASAGYVQQYSAEYLPRTDGASVLEQISTITGGTVLANTTDIALTGGQQRGETTSLWMWFLLAAILLWPIEIAVRRGWLRL